VLRGIFGGNRMTKEEKERIEQIAEANEKIYNEFMKKLANNEN